MLTSATNAVLFLEAVERTAPDAKCSDRFGLVVAVASVRFEDVPQHVCEQINVPSGFEP
jgi:hypothetical protein